MHVISPKSSDDYYHNNNSTTREHNNNNNNLSNNNNKNLSNRRVEINDNTTISKSKSTKSTLVIDYEQSNNMMGTNSDLINK